MRGAKKPTQGGIKKIKNDQLSSPPIISPLHAIAGLERISRSRKYPSGSTVFVEGHVAGGLYVVRSGRVKLSINSADGRKLIVRIARPGDLLGVGAALTASAYEATAETLAPCVLELVPRKELLALLERQQHGGLGLAIALSRDHAALVEYARNLLLSDSATEKLARLLLSFGDQFGSSTSSGIRFETMLTHEELAQMIGASRETVTRSLNVLKRKQLISGNGEMLIRNRAALLSFVENPG